MDGRAGGARAEDARGALVLPRWLVALGILGALGLLGAVWSFYRAEEQELRGRVGERLESTARLQARQIARWRSDQLEDAGLIANHPWLPSELGSADPTPVDAKLREFFRQVQREHDYDEVLVVDRSGAVRWSLAGWRDQVPAAVGQKVRAALSSGRVELADYVESSDPGSLRLAGVAPLPGRELGLVLVNDSSQALQPLLSWATTSSASGETLLVQRDGEEVRLPEGLQGNREDEGVLRLPLSEAERPSVRAALGERGVVSGRDYRGVEVLAALEAVPDSPWHLVAKLDEDEALADWRARSRLGGGLLVLALATVAAAGALVWQRRRQAQYRALYRLEAERRAVAERYAATLKAVGDAVIVTDAGGRVDLLNAEAERLTGWSEPEARERPLREVFWIFDASGQKPAEPLVERILREGVVVGLTNHTVLRSRDGVERPIADSGAPVLDPDGAVVGVVLVFRDESERSAQEQALRSAEARSRTILESAPDAIFVQVGGRFAYLNPSAARLLGAERAEDVLGTPVLERFDPSRHAAVRERIRKLNEERPPVELAEETILTLDGEPVPVEVVAVPVDFDGEAGALVFVRDARRRKQEQADRERLTAAVEQVAEAVVITDRKGVIRYANPACERQTGYARGELVGNTPRLFKSGAQDRAFYHLLWETILSGETWHGLMQNRRKDGSRYTVEATITPVVNDAGAITEFVSIQLDVTERLALEDQLRHAQRLSAVGQLAGGIAHDFNNLLTVINGYGEMAASRAEDEGLARQLSTIVDAGKRAAALTGQLLAFSRKQVLQPRVVALNELIDGLGDMLGRLLGEDVDLRLNLQPDLRKVEVDPGQLEQVVMNLAVNARDAMPAGGKLTIETADVDLDEGYARSHAEVTPGPHVLLAVSDTGEGMDAETRARLFEPFFTTKDQGRGTGLGLATVYGVVKQSDGHIWVYSELGRGTTFKVYLPQASGTTSPAQEPEPAPDAAGQDHGTILVVEDEDAVRDLVAEVLEGAGYRVLATGDADEALRICGDVDMDLDLLLTDVVLPTRSGREVAEGALEGRPGLKVVYMSGYTDNAIVHHGVLDPGTPFIAKPFSPTELLKNLRGFLA